MSAARLSANTKGAFLLAILLDMAGGRIDRAWLFPMSDLPSVARERPDKYSITPSAKDESRDRYTPYRCSEMTEVARRLAAYLDRQSDSGLQRQYD